MARSAILVPRINADGSMSAELLTLPGPKYLPGGCHPAGRDYERWAGIADEDDRDAAADLAAESAGAREREEADHD